MKAVALVVSARKHGNCFDFAQFSLNQLAVQGVETELVNFHDYQITPCQRCAYECLNHLSPHPVPNAVCPIQDDVRMIWEKTWESEIVLLFTPTYGGMPPALWLAFSQRQQAFFREAPLDKLKKSVISAVLLSTPHQSSGAPWIASFMGDEVKGMDRKVVGFEIINQTQFDINYIITPLIEETEIQRRIAFMVSRTLCVAQELNGIKRKEQ